ncbi:MAG TPA: tail fiber domain-containing protein [Bacteroidia bacterium]|nr:tail fiber domain-containing protein [Bacteroidia bacterium]
MKKSKILFGMAALIVAASNIKAQSIFTPGGGITGPVTNTLSTSLGFNSGTVDWAPLEIKSNVGPLTNGGWGRSIVLYPWSQSRTSTITWEKGNCFGCNNSFFIGGPSIIPPGDYWIGLTDKLNNGTQDMITQYYGTPTGTGINIVPQGTARYNHNLLVTDFNTGKPSRFAIRTFNPRQAGHVNEGNFLITGRASKKEPFNNGSVLFSDADPGTNPDYNGNWGIQYITPGYFDPTDPGGLNFWTTANNPSGFVNNRLYLSNTNGNIGINNFNPLNQLEITSDGNDPVPSGLRFTNLTSASASQPGYGKVLTVDGSGDVILVDDQIGALMNLCVTPLFVPKVQNAAGDQVCSQIYDDGTNVGVGTTFPLHKLDVAGYVNAAQHNGYKIFNMTVLKDQGTANIFAGGNCGSPTLADNMTTNGNTYAGFNCGANNKWSSYNTFMGFNTGYNAKGTGQNDNNCTMNTLIGAASGNVLQPTSSAEYAIGNTLVGYYAATNLTNGVGNTSLGSSSLFGAVSGDQNTFIGMYTATWSATVPTNCSVLGYNAQVPVAGPVNNATAIGADAYVGCSDCMVLGSVAAGLINQVSVGIGYNSPGTTGVGGPFLLAVNNNGLGNSAWFNGNIWALGGTWNPSDAALKDNIQPFTNADKIINNLITHTFTFNSADYRGLHLPKGPQIGFIAEELERVLPSLVQEVSSPEQRNAAGELLYPSYTFKGVNYEGLIPILVSHAKEQNQKIASLITRDSLREIRLADLESIVNSCCRMQAPQQGNNNGQSERTSSVQVSINARLEQNVPNPFNEKTIIKYYVPQSSSSASLKIYSLDGAELKTFSITQKGTGEVEISGNTLAPGTYVYHLIVDEKQVDGKLMTLTK